MKSSTKRVLSLFGTVTLFILTLAAYSLMFAPAYESVNALRGEFLSRQGAFEEQSRIVTKVNELISQYQGTARIEDTVSQTLPRESNSAQIVNQLSALSSASGIGLQQVSMQTQALRPGSSDPNNPVKAVGVVEVNLRLFGPYDAFKRFLQGIETNVRLMDAVNWRAETPERGVQAPMTFNVVINAYYQAE